MCRAFGVHFFWPTLYVEVLTMNSWVETHKPRRFIRMQLLFIDVDISHNRQVARSDIQQ